MDIASDAVDAFILAVGAKPSEKPRKFSHIYWVYLKYCILNNLEPFHKTTFARALAAKVKAKFSEHRHETHYYLDCELFNLKYEDKLALKEYKKEEHLWLLQERKRKKHLKKLRRTLREKKRLKKEKERAIRDSKKDSSPVSNKNTTTTITLNDYLQKIKNS